MPSSPNTFAALRSRSVVVRWTVLGTLGCMVIAVCFNILVFADLGRAAMQRAVISAMTLPIIVGAPLFLLMSLRLRGMALSNVRLKFIARTDALTACLNRAAFTTKVEAMLAKARREDRHGALLVIDADNFKSINDRFGHDRGDEALTLIARSIRAIMRPGDLVGRIGGEEFAVYLPNTDIKSAMIIAERIRRAVSLAIFTPAGLVRPLTVSLGGAVFETAPDFSELFRAADQNLYAAKQSGRNRIEIGAWCDGEEDGEIAA
jgi:diguanylate cyclase (GGDEF)-like protein